MSTPASRKAFDIETLRAIGVRIREARGSRTQEEFAEALGVSRSALTNYEAGRRLPNDLVLKRIAAISGISEPKLLFGPTVTPFEIYRERVNAAAMDAAQRHPGYIPRFMVSDDEYALIALLRLMHGDGLSLPIVQAVADHTRKWLHNDAAPLEPPVQWGEGYLERLDNVLTRGEMEEGYDPDQMFWVTFWEESNARDNE